MFRQRGPNVDNVVFLVDEGKEDPSTTISHFMDFAGPTLNAGLLAAIYQRIRTCIARKPFFVIFKGVPDPHMSLIPRKHAIMKSPEYLVQYQSLTRAFNAQTH